MSENAQVTTAIGEKLYFLIIDQACWSQDTFGKDSERGPRGAIRHLQKEALEAEQAIDKEGFAEEMADCLLLIIDASRRGGIKIMELIDAAQRKMQVNKSRQWPNPIADEPVEHLK